MCHNPQRTLVLLLLVETGRASFCNDDVKTCVISLFVPSNMPRMMMITIMLRDIARQDGVSNLHSHRAFHVEHHQQFHHHQQ